ncbi:tRNA (adenosine(37)-N6)-threonylcarbamoyltransferase complex ATPase subunit type 1 TsaE [Bizionia paragorgiae]|uniref:tRNA (adenosine(37)-N6)-threonylcarbamoyltransferase complex ATPase subunit type 1 TsaE n=1 Tax=Bizionia paragorgiae TaxID=283786 RepID=UPI00299DA229|nr:tRNA (adenosine(37)-N6)-threonylcarbamoyltransferase complex ATPase subunit type 1 TsaE [Bizionia paragorgiae]MDX1270902.1 tRNA (adenosine(37)-N6)-threonylcarbamoyltransferase complex ATPase subunit type 1 TsaE [Bizionia paragorgiae]
MEIEYSLESLKAVADEIINTTTRSNIILFNGDLGTGKTTLIKELVKTMGCDDTVSSPTYSLVNEYHSDSASIYHFDLYRLEHEDELYDFGIEDYLDAPYWKFVEWPSLLKPLLRDGFYEITIERVNNEKRKLQLQYISNNL